MRQQTLQFLGQKIHQIRSLLAFLGGSFEVLMATVAMLTVSMFILRHSVTLTVFVLLVVWDVAWLGVLDKGIRNLFNQRRTKWTKRVFISGAIWEVAGPLALLLGTWIDGRTNSPLNLLNQWIGWKLDLIALVGYIVLAILGAGQLILHPILVRRAAARRRRTAPDLTLC